MEWRSGCDESGGDADGGGDHVSNAYGDSYEAEEQKKIEFFSATCGIHIGVKTNFLSRNYQEFSV